MKKLIFLPIILLLAGCWDKNQPEQMYYIHGLGVDYKDGQYEIFAQIIDFTNIAKSEQPNPETAQAEVGKAKGRTLDEAFFNLYQSMDERLFYGFLEFVILSQNLAKENKVEPIVNSFIRYRELRYTTWVYVTNTSLEEILLTSPIINKSLTLSKLSVPLNSYNQSSRIRPIYLRELMIQLHEPSHEVKIPFIEVAENWAKEDEPDSVYSISGYSIIGKTTGFKGNLLGDSSNGIQWLTNETNRSDVTVKTEGFEELYTTTTVDEVMSSVKPIVSGNSVQFDIDVQLSVQTNEMVDENKMNKLKKAIENQVKKEIEETYKAALELDIDIYRLSEFLYRKNVKAWKEVEKDGKVPLNETSIRNLNVELIKVKGERITSK